MQCTVRIPMASRLTGPTCGEERQSQAPARPASQPCLGQGALGGVLGPAVLPFCHPRSPEELPFQLGSSRDQEGTTPHGCICSHLPPVQPASVLHGNSHAFIIPWIVVKTANLDRH